MGNGLSRVKVGHGLPRHRGGNFFVRPQAISSSRPEFDGASRAAAVKAGRRFGGAASRAAARPRLDGGEHDARLAGGGMKARDERRDVILDWAVNEACGSTASPWIGSGALARNPDLSCTGASKAQQRRDPSERAGQVRPWMTTVTRLSWFTSAAMARGRSDGWTQHGAGRHHAGLEITPQCHHKLAGQRHDGDASDASLEVTHPLTEPTAQSAVGLVPQPQPGELDRQRARPPVAGFADALVASTLSAVVRRAGEPEVTADLTAIGEGAVEHLVDQCRPAGRADTLEVDELHDLGLGRTGSGGLPFRLALAFQRRQLLVDQGEPLMLARDLLLGPRWQWPSIPGAQGIETGDEARLEWCRIAHALRMQLRVAVIVVRGAFLAIAFPFTASTLAILVFHRWHMVHAAGPRLAPQMAEQRPHQLLQVDPIGLGLPCTPVAFDARWIDLVIDDSLVRQPPVQPVPVEARLVAREDADRPAGARRFRPCIRKPCGQRHQIAAGDRVAAHLRRARHNQAKLPFGFAQFKSHVHGGILRTGGCVSAIEVHHLGPSRLDGSCNSNPNLLTARHPIGSEGA